jgi:hypothetical protein
MFKLIRSEERNQTAMDTEDPREISKDNLNNIRHRASRYFRNKKRSYERQN